MITRDTIIKRLQMRRHEHKFYVEQIFKTPVDEPICPKMEAIRVRLDQDITILEKVLIMWEEGRSEEAKELLKKVP